MRRGGRGRLGQGVLRMEPIDRRAPDAAKFRCNIARAVPAMPSPPSVARARAAGISKPEPPLFWLAVFVIVPPDRSRGSGLWATVWHGHTDHERSRQQCRH